MSEIYFKRTRQLPDGTEEVLQDWTRYEGPVEMGESQTVHCRACAEYVPDVCCPATSARGNLCTLNAGHGGSHEAHGVGGELFEAWV